MAKRSQFQGAALYFSATTLAASTILGNAGLSIGEWLEMARDQLAALLPQGIEEGGGDNNAHDILAHDIATETGATTLLPTGWTEALPKGLDGWLAGVVELFMVFGWSLGALGAAVWNRLQAVALGALAMVSAECVRQSVTEGLLAGGEQSIAASILQLVALVAAGTGLMSKGRNVVLRNPGRNLRKAGRQPGASVLRKSTSRSE